MTESFQTSGPQNSPPTRFPISLLLAALVLIALLVGLWFQFGRSGPANPSSVPDSALRAMTPDEQAYASSIKIENVALSRAENFIHQQVIILNADVSNRGTLSVDTLFLQVEFDDSMGQIALKESRGVLGRPSIPLASGQSRRIELSFDHVPASWNMQQPAVRVSSLHFAPYEILKKY